MELVESYYFNIRAFCHQCRRFGYTHTDMLPYDRYCPNCGIPMELERLETPVRKVFLPDDETKYHAFVDEVEGRMIVKEEINED